MAWFGVAAWAWAWDVGHDWMLTSASVMALASFGLVLVAVTDLSLCLLSGVRVRAQASHAL